MKRILSLYSLIAILIAAGTANLHAQNVVVDKKNLTFLALLSGPVPAPQTVNVNSSTGAAIAFAAFPDAAAPWLKVANPNPTTPSSITVSADPTGLAPGVRTGTISVVSGVNTETVTVSLTVSTIGVSASSITFSGYTTGSQLIPAAQTITLSSQPTSYTAVASTTNGGNWLLVTPQTGPSPSTISVALNAGILPGLPAGAYIGQIALTPAGTGAVPIAIPVTLTVSSTPQVTVTPSTAIFNVQSGGTNNPANQTVTIATNPPQPLNYFLTGSGSAPWITFSPPAGTTDATTGAAQVTIGYNTAGLTVGKTYTDKITLSTPSGTPAQTSIDVVLNYSANPFLNVSPSSVSFAAQFGSDAVDKTIAVSSTDGSPNATYSVSKSTNSDWLVVPNAGSTAAPITVSARSAALAPGVYTATITVTPSAPGSSSTQIPVTLTVTNDPSILVNVTTLSFPYQLGIGQIVQPQNLAISSSTGVTLNYTAVPATASCGSGWLLLNGFPSQVTSSTASPGPITVNVATANLTAGTCTGTIAISATNAATGAAAPPVSVQVTVVVSIDPLLLAAPTTVSFAAAAGSSPAQQTIRLSSTSTADALTCAITSVSGSVAGTNWLVAGLTAGASCNNVLGLSVFSSTLPAADYTGSVTIVAKTASGANTANSPFVIPVNLTVTSGTLNLSTGSLSYQYTLGGQPPAAQTVTVSGTQPLSYSAAVANPAQTPWLSVSPANGTTNANPTLTVTVDSSKLTTAQSYTGAITVTSPHAANSPATINVTVTVAPGTISAPTTTLTFNQLPGGAAPAAQTIAVTGAPGALNFTAAPSANTPWLTVTPASGATPGNVQVTASAGSLAVGQYTGSVIITSTGATGSPITVPVVLNVVASQTLSANPASLTFAYTTGLTAPAAQSLAVTITGPTAVINAQVQTTPATPWLTVTPTTTNSPATFSVSVTPGLLAAGTYTSSISISSPNALTPLAIPVTLTVATIPKPVVTAIVNAGSYATGSISPGEIIAMFGTGIGPAVGVGGVYTGGVLGSTVGNTRVLFDGAPAPILYASATQTNVIVPYGVNGRTTTNVVVEYSGVASSAIAYNVAAAAPGIYTLNQQGTGPGAVVNENGATVNSAATPAARGSVISVYMTGEGQTAPAGSDGAVIPPVASALKKPLLTVTATVNGIDAPVLYAGSAPGFVSGAMQVNIRIPDNAPAGAAVPLIVKVGTASSQSGVTIALQ